MKEWSHYLMLFTSKSVTISLLTFIKAIVYFLLFFHHDLSRVVNQHQTCDFSPFNGNFYRYIKLQIIIQASLFIHKLQILYSFNQSMYLCQCIYFFFMYYLPQKKMLLLTLYKSLDHYIAGKNKRFIRRELKLVSRRRGEFYSNVFE